MSPAPSNRPRKASKELIILGGLCVVFVIVLVIQLGGDEEAPAGEAVAAAADGTEVAALAETATSPVSPAADVVPDNPVLGDDGGTEGLQKSPFTRFWEDFTDDPAEEEVEAELPVPTARLSATMPSGGNPIAMIDGSIRHVGDNVQGWRIESIQARSVKLVSPSGAHHELSMPLLSLSGGQR